MYPKGRDIETLLRPLRRIDTMTTTSETDFKELRELINNQFGQLDKQMSQLDKKIEVGVTEIKGDIRRVEEKLEAKIDGIDKRLTDLNNKVDKLEGRVNVQVNWFLGIITGLVSVLLTALVRLVFFPSSNP